MTDVTDAKTQEEMKRSIFRERGEGVIYDAYCYRIATIVLSFAAVVLSSSTAFWVVMHALHLK